MHPEKFYKYVIERTLENVPEPERGKIKSLWNSKLFKKKTNVIKIKNINTEDLSKFNSLDLINKLTFYPNFIKINKKS